ncbi:hypothetical protein D3C85_664670 [compost metagenome]
MAKIRIHLDGTFESLSAKAVDMKVLRKDLSIARKISGLRSKAAKKADAIKAARKKSPSSPAIAKLVNERGTIMSDIKHLITTLSNKTHANLQVIGAKYHKLQQAKVKVTPSKVVRKPKAVQDEKNDPYGVIQGEEELERLEDLVFQLKTRMTRFDNIIRSEPGPKKLANAKDEVKKLGKELMTAESDLEEAKQNLHRIHH